MNNSPCGSTSLAYAVLFPLPKDELHILCEYAGIVHDSTMSIDELCSVLLTQLEK